ncbi:MAG: hypothetical protein IPL22_04865 [Bacteroidetes bacterium]|nr:hypothetical protein [Bacteroidota bacterium]
MNNKHEKHFYNVKYAKEYGVSEAILINYFQFWITKNRNNPKSNKDGKTWTYISRTDLAKVFEYFTVDQIKTIILNLIDKHVLIKGNYNLMKVDKTSWYAFEDEGKFIENTENPHWVDLPNGCSELPNPLGENPQCIGDNYPTLPVSKLLRKLLINLLVKIRK